jgi:hypothetical protein
LVEYIRWITPVLPVRKNNFERNSDGGKAGFSNPDDCPLLTIYLVFLEYQRFFKDSNLEGIRSQDKTTTERLEVLFFKLVVMNPHPYFTKR